VNPLLANPVYLAGYIEQVGTGTNDVIGRCVALGLKKPEFRQDEDFTVVMWRRGDLGEDASNESSREQVVAKQSLSNHQVVIKLSPSVPMICDLLKKMIAPMSAKEMRQFCGLKDATYFKMAVIDPLIEGGLVAMTQPGFPKSPTQKYYLTELGKTLLKK
jgi:Predicted transcriptional regulator containing an HTH domain and an uncharacterized domain shared with the mammalian protein Schlafen